jgi:lipopolysaccharide export LptBFGC system permease protein LptF
MKNKIQPQKGIWGIISCFIFGVIFIFGGVLSLTDFLHPIITVLFFVIGFGLWIFGAYLLWDLIEFLMGKGSSKD